MKLSTNEFLSAFFGADDDICFRIFSDRKDEDESYKGNKYTEKLKNIDAVLPALQQHNEKNRGIFFVVNSGGHSDGEIIRINAQFVESDTLSFDEQMERIDSFPLPPSIIIKTKKSLHTYWLMQDAEVSRFREIQLRLAKYFDGDTQCQNESRVLRLPGFMHCKNEPVEVECVKFEPNLRYTQEQLAEHLPEVEMPTTPVTDTNSAFEGKVGSGQRLLDNCVFCKYCQDNAKTLSEPAWYAFVSNMALAKDGSAIVHEISKPYPKYNRAETDEKICHAITENKPHTCEYIQRRLGFKGCSDCKVKAPVVHSILTLAEQVAELLETEITEDLIFDSKTIELMSYAKNNLPAEYGKFKLKIKGKVSMRDFENAVKHKEKNREFLIVEDTDMPLNLTGINLGNAVQPSNWDVSMDKGVRKVVKTKDGATVIVASPTPLVISRRFENIDDDSEKVEVAFYRNNRWKRVIAPRSQMFNKGTIIKYADSGLPVSSDSAPELVRYISDYENANISNISFVKSISRIGWVGKQFYPYDMKEEIYFDTEYKEAIDIMKSLKQHGEYVLWKENIIKARENELARFLISASFASPLLVPLNHRVFFVHIWHDSKSGKTAAIKAGISAWGNPAKLMGSFNATSVGLERMAGTLKHLPFAIDELQVLNEKRLSIETIIYGLANGFGRLRGSKDGGVQDLVTWRNIVITSGEQPLSKENSNDGILTRALELYGKPVLDVEFAHDLHLISENNYGFAGDVFIRYITNLLKNNGDVIRHDYDAMKKDIKARFGASPHLDNTAVVCLGDYYSSVCVFDEDKSAAWQNAVGLAVCTLENNKQLQQPDTISRAWDFVVGWIIGNKARFENTATPCFGTSDGDKYYIIPSYLREALEQNGFDYIKVTRGFKDRGYFESRKEWDGVHRAQIVKKINGVACRVFAVHMESMPDDPIPLRG